MRWLVVFGISASGFALVWLVAEGIVGLDRSTAVTIAVAAGSLLSTPFIRWANEEPAPVVPTDRATAPTGGAVTEPPATPRSRAPSYVLAAMVGLLVLVGVAQALGDRSPRSPGPSASSTTANEPGASQSLEVNRTAWYAGYKITFGRAAYSGGDARVLSIDAVVENLGPRNVSPDLRATFSIGNTHVEGGLRQSANIPGRQKADVTFEFSDIDLGTAGLADGVLTFGDAEVVQTVVPLAGADGFVPNQPRQVLRPTTVMNEDIRYEFAGCDLRADYAPQHEQVPAGRRVLACFADATYTGPARFHIVDERNFLLKQPDGNKLGATHYPIMNLDSMVTADDIYIAFAIKEHVSGRFTIVLSSADLGESEAEGTHTEIPMTL